MYYIKHGSAFHKFQSYNNTIHSHSTAGKAGQGNNSTVFAPVSFVSVAPSLATAEVSGFGHSVHIVLTLAKFR